MDKSNTTKNSENTNAAEVNAATQTAAENNPTSTTASTPIKALNKQNQIELRALIMERGGEQGKKDIADIDAQKLSVAKTRQELINLASSFLPEDQVFGKQPKPKAEKAPKVNAKIEVNTKALTEAWFVAAGDNFENTDKSIVVTKEQVEKSTPKQLQALINPKAPKAEFKGYTPEDIATFDANVGKFVDFVMGGKAEKGVVKSHRIYTPTGRALYNVLCDGKIRSVSVSSDSLKFGEMAPVDTKKADEKAAAEKAKADAKATKEAEKKAAQDAKDKAKAEKKEVKGATDANDKPVDAKTAKK